MSKSTGNITEHIKSIKVIEDCNNMLLFGLEDLKNYNGLKTISTIFTSKKHTFNIDSLINPYAIKQITTK
jgi:hypothetical protein